MANWTGSLYERIAKVSMRVMGADRTLANHGKRQRKCQSSPNIQSRESSGLLLKLRGVDQRNISLWLPRVMRKEMVWLCGTR